MSATPLVRLRPKSGARARAGAPWIFSNEIDMTPAAKALPRGTIVEVVGDDGSLLGTGGFNPHSLIAVRLLRPRARGPIDANFFRERIKGALALRDALYDKPYYRLIHGEGDGLPGLVIDRFGDIVSVQANTATMDALQPHWLDALKAELAPAAIVARNDAPARALEGLPQSAGILSGALDGPVTVWEGACRYAADLLGGQKTGWYYDQRDWHLFMARLAKGRTVLDAFCYAGGFGIQALASGAESVRFLDSSEPALALVRRNLELNNLTGRAEFIRGDAMDELEKLQSAQRFGIVVTDPPPFVRARKDLEAGAKAYRKLGRLSANLVAPGGFLYLASCSHAIETERFVQESVAGVARAGRIGRIIASGGAGPDHPVHPHLPESAYLKALVFQLD
jgi:23S rRNA (cytosine1962-C5)-methyltransferase